MAGVAQVKTAWKMSASTARKSSGPKKRCVTTASMRSLVVRAEGSLRRVTVRPTSPARAP